MSTQYNSEIMQIISAISDQRGIKEEVLTDALKEGIRSISGRKYGNENTIEVSIDKAGNITINRILEVVEIVQDPTKEITIDDALRKNSDPLLKIGDKILDQLPPIPSGRVDIKTVDQILINRVSEATRRLQIEVFSNRVNTIISGMVKSVEYGNIIIDLNGAEAILPKAQQLKNEYFKIHDRVKAYVQDVKFSEYGPQIFLSRTDERFLRELLKMEILEIYDNIVEIKAVAREAGSKSKVAVFSHDITVDPISVCIGVGGGRIRSIINELAGEKVDIIQWDSNIANFIMNAMSPATISKIIFDEEQNNVQVVVPQSQYSLSIGKRGQNVRLASKITGWNISIVSEEEESRVRTEEFNKNTKIFIEKLQVDELIAQLLASEGYRSIGQIASASIDDLTTIERFDVDIATELQRRALEYINSKNQKLLDQLEKLGMSEILLNQLISFIPLKHILALAEYGLKTPEDFEYVTTNQISKIIPNNIMKSEEIDQLRNSILSSTR